jgi:hypothetical protein
MLELADKTQTLSGLARNDPAKSKVYIAIREDIINKDLGHACLSAVHGMMALARDMWDDEHFQAWAHNSFRKFVGIANEKEWIKLKQVDAKHCVMTECGIPGNPEVSIIFEPMCGDEIPNVLKFMRPLSWKTLGRQETPPWE